MKKKILITLAAVLLAAIGLMGYFKSATKKASPPGVASYSNKGMDLSVIYCRPYKKGRVIFGDEQAGALQPYGKYWRAGANEATVFSTNVPVMINDQRLDAGKYALYAIPNRDKWMIAFNRDYDRWGVMRPDESDDVVKTEVPADNNAALQEQFVISFDAPPADSSNQTALVLHWDQTMVKVPVKPAR